MLATDTRELQFNGNSARRVDASMPAHSEPGAGSDEVLKALGELDAVLKENAERERVLFQRIAEVRLARENGQEWKSILADEDEPSTVQLVSTILGVSPKPAATFAAHWSWPCAPKDKAFRALPIFSGSRTSGCRICCDEWPKVAMAWRTDFVPHRKD